VIHFIAALVENPSWQDVVLYMVDAIVPLVGIWLAYKYGATKSK
jgi:hypothetical protein